MEHTQLIESHLSLVRTLAAVVYKRIRGAVDFDDLMSMGHEGLIQAARRYDRSRGVPFAAYARRRIKGAMLDGICAAAPLSRSQYKKSQESQAEDAMTRPTTDSSRRRTSGEDMTVTATQEAFVEKQKVATILARAMTDLPDKQRCLLLSHYFEGKTLEQAGRDMGLSKSWASRLHKRAISCLSTHTYLTSDYLAAIA